MKVNDGNAAVGPNMELTHSAGGPHPPTRRREEGRRIRTGEDT